jgi:hypothetical protein
MSLHNKTFSARASAAGFIAPSPKSEPEFWELSGFTEYSAFKFALLSEPGLARIQGFSE